MAKPLDAGALSAFFEGMSLMLAAGIQMDEAAGLMGDNIKRGPFKDACEAVYSQLIQGKSLTDAMRASGRFPAHSVNMMAAGERSGRLEATLQGLSVYYSEESRLRSKMRSGIVYPVALLGVMTVILAITVVAILPVFFDVYNSLTGDVAAGAFSYVSVSAVIGWVALGVMALVAIVAIVLTAATASAGGRRTVIGLLSKLPMTRDAMYRHALSRFTSVLATYVAAGIDSNEAMHRAMGDVENAALRRKAEAAYNDMVDPTKAKSLSQAVADNDIFDPVYARMLAVGVRSGSDDRVLQRLSDAYFEDSVAQVDEVIDSVEPALAVVLTVGVGATLVAVMLPLVGIMGSIG